MPVTIAGVWFWGVPGAVWALAVTGAVQWALTHAAVRVHARPYGIPITVRGWSQEQRVLWTFSVPALAQGETVVPFTDLPATFNPTPTPDRRVLDV